MPGAKFCPQLHPVAPLKSVAVPSVTEGRIQLFKYARGYQANWQQLQGNNRSVEGKN